MKFELKDKASLKMQIKLNKGKKKKKDIKENGKEERIIFEDKIFQQRTCLSVIDNIFRFLSFIEYVNV